MTDCGACGPQDARNAAAGEEVEELDAEQKRGRGLPAGPVRAEGVEDDDMLLVEDAEEDLEGEQAISEASDRELDDEDDDDAACEAWRPMGQLPWRSWPGETLSMRQARARALLSPSTLPFFPLPVDAKLYFFLWAQ